MLANILIRQNISKACMRFLPSGKGGKGWQISTGCKLIRSGSSNRRNGTGSVLDRGWKDKGKLEVVRKSGKLMMAKQVIYTVLLNVISICTTGRVEHGE